MSPDVSPQRTRRRKKRGDRSRLVHFGYSNLAYISRFPISRIKIDKSFVDELPNSLPIIRTIQTLAEQFGAVTVAEGVETEEQMTHLREVDCRYIQGYVYAKPMSSDELPEATKRIEASAGSR